MKSDVYDRSIERVVVGGARTRDRDHLVVEAPLELRAQGRSIVVVMRTPGSDRELATGLLFAEGAIESAAELAGMCEPTELREAERGNVLELGLAPEVVNAMSARSMFASSSCGVCGKQAIADLERRVPAVASGLTVDAAVIGGLPDALRAGQAVFDETGALHAAGAFDAAGTALAVREDVGRHNAVDKLVGHLLGAEAAPMSRAILCVSGRLSFEIVQKAVVAGFPVVVAVSAPSSLAVDVAERFRVTLCGFTRGGRFNIYSHGQRVV